MAAIPINKERGTITLADRIRRLEEQRRFSERESETEQKTKFFKFPRKWTRKFSQAKRKNKAEMVLVLFFNKKNEIEPPKFMPIFDGNLIIWKNKPYEFDPRAIWRIRGMKGTPQAYCIREIDRRPIKNYDGTYKRDKEGRIIYGSDAAVSNMDIEEVRARGDSTESDEFLIKAALRAQTVQTKKNVNIAIIVIVAILAIGGLIWFLTSK